ncbi:MAG: hypothetical protein IPM58_12035, partial [Nitrospira sp.]|nr:hypothetical protein [Nitrospira sp.]
MSQSIGKKSLVVGIAVASPFVGAITGYFAAHRMMSDMSGMQSSGEIEGSWYGRYADGGR